MANGQGERADEAGRTAWSGSSTPPNVYGNFSRPGLADDLMDAEPTAEDLAPPPDIRKAHQVREKMHNHLAELEESGEYDIRALAPLRHLLDQDWTDPNVRSRLKAKVEAEDARLRQAPAAATPPAKTWFENVAEAETIAVPQVPFVPQLPPGMPAEAVPPQSAVVEDYQKRLERSRPPDPPAPRPQAPYPTLPVRPPVPAQPAAAGSPGAADPMGFAAPPAASAEPARPIPAYPAPPPKPANFPGYPTTAAGLGAPEKTALPSAAQAPKAPAFPSPQEAFPPADQGFDLEFDQDNGPGQDDEIRARAAQLQAEPRARRSKRNFHPWLLAAGAGLIAAALALPESVFAGEPVVMGPPSFVLTSEPKADVLRGDEVIGQTPMVLEEGQIGDGLTLRATGFDPRQFSLPTPLSETKVVKHNVVLAPSAVALNWTGLPEGSKITWQGQPATTETLATAKAGAYKLSVVAPGRPDVALVVTVPDPKDGVEELAVGQQIAAALARQPALSVSLKSGKKAPKLPLAVTITGNEQGKSFKKTANLDGKASSKLVLPGPGTYQIKVPATATHQAYSKKLVLTEGASQNLEIALEPVPPKVAAAPASSGGGGSYYAPEPVYYSPPPVYYSGGGGGGGGGGGSIAPPSF